MRKSPDVKPFSGVERRRNPSRTLEPSEGNEVTVFHELGKALTSSLQLDQVLRTIMEKITEVLQPDTWSLLLMDTTKHELYFQIATGKGSDALKDVRIKMGQGLAGWVAQSGQAIVVPDTTKDERFIGHADRQVVAERHVRLRIADGVAVEGARAGTVRLELPRQRVRRHHAEGEVGGFRKHPTVAALDAAEVDRHRVAPRCQRLRRAGDLPLQGHRGAPEARRAEEPPRRSVGAVRAHQVAAADLALDRLREVQVADVDFKRDLRAIWLGARTPPPGAVRELIDHILRQQSDE